VGLERGPLSLLITSEELLGRRSSGCGLETEIAAVGICRADHATPPRSVKFALLSPTNGRRSVGIVRSRTKATELLILANVLVVSTCISGQNCHSQCRT
jgi:hypothetical protein